MMSTDPLTDEKLDQDAAVAAAAAQAYDDSIATSGGSRLDRLGEAAGFMQDDIEDAWARSREISHGIGAIACAAVRSAPVASMGLAFGLGYVISRLRSGR